MALPTTAKRRASSTLMMPAATDERTATPIAMIPISVITTTAKVTARAVALELIARLGTATTATVHASTTSSSGSSTVVHHVPSATAVSTPIARPTATAHSATTWVTPTARREVARIHRLVLLHHRAGNGV